MGDNKAGNIEAIRDWSKRYFYTKSDVAEFFAKSLNGLTAYKLTIIGPANTIVTITDNDQSDPQEYVIETADNGTYVDLFFFNAGNTLTLSGQGVSATHVLDDYMDTIELINIEILTPIMTSNTTPATDGEVIYSTQYSGYLAYMAFDQNTSTRWNGSNSQATEYIGYRFINPACVTKIVLKPFYDQNAGVITFKHGVFQASNDGDTWYDLKTISIPNENMEHEIVIPVSTTYSYYRLYCDDSYVGSGAAKFYSFYEVKFYGYRP